MRSKKIPNDHRRYQSFQLPNQLSVLLISDLSTDKAAAAVDVHVGSSSDPDHLLGLAHFLEHMLFLGTQKSPIAGEFKDYIMAHGGSYNATTAFSHTSYFFDNERRDIRKL
jgi:secreted Zn-dependent insulinase-like peptidase